MPSFISRKIISKVQINGCLSFYYTQILLIYIFFVNKDVQGQILRPLCSGTTQSFKNYLGLHN